MLVTELDAVQNRLPSRAGLTGEGNEHGQNSGAGGGSCGGIQRAPRDFDQHRAVFPYLRSRSSCGNIQRTSLAFDQYNTIATELRSSSTCGDIQRTAPSFDRSAVVSFQL